MNIDLDIVDKIITFLSGSLVAILIQVFTYLNKRSKLNVDKEQTLTKTAVDSWQSQAKENERLRKELDELREKIDKRSDEYIKGKVDLQNQVTSLLSRVGILEKELERSLEERSRIHSELVDAQTQLALQRVEFESKVDELSRLTDFEGIFLERILLYILRLGRGDYATAWCYHNGSKIDGIPAMFMSSITEIARDGVRLDHRYKQMPAAMFRDIISASSEKKMLIIKCDDPEYDSVSSNLKAEGIKVLVLFFVYNEERRLIGFISTSWKEKKFFDEYFTDELLWIAKNMLVVSAIQKKINEIELKKEKAPV